MHNLFLGIWMVW